MQMQVRTLRRTSVDAGGGLALHPTASVLRITEERDTAERRTDFGAPDTHSQQKLKEASHQAW